MDDKQLEKFIGYMVMAIFASYILQLIIPFLIWAVIGMVAWRIIQEYQKHKH
jgi:hypothetical protein